MLAKLIVWAPNRELAVERMHRALLELTIEGVETSRDFHLRLMEDSEFRAGAIEIQWLERRLPSLAAVKAPGEAMRAAVIAAALLADRDRNRGVIQTSGSKMNEPRVAATSDAWRKVARREGLR
jgi:acetyl-CoA carboxylase biotin carboxylase subunit